MLLCLEASTDTTVIGLYESAERFIERTLADRDRLAEEVRELLGEWPIEPRALTGIALGSGPGSFTGLRVSYAFAKGLARGAELKIFPISSLKVIAANYLGDRKSVAVISPARRNAVHWSAFATNSLEIVSDHAVVPHEDLRGKLAGEMVLIGPGLAKLNDEVRAQIESFLPSKPTTSHPQVKHLARLALEYWRDKQPPDIGVIVPEYGLDFPA
ncbi:tRNA (adenosine(37)-N6)-threonylcarbamoyltransferase complex dimerization subunit type 1 TsaB [bacterium]|nr:tRNA (adenosine(37)-N6)-threonylcarbamoyltransferase complex dimerization subunit type 1 TsaB [bacterium]MBU1983043.1 tRNA (adenosine(37)-N6)-threonylcarbamoyltransferase complex dimerization subunit type 1 TsaB [bacterium]